MSLTSYFIVSFTEIEERSASGEEQREEELVESPPRVTLWTGRMAEKPKEHTACSSVKWVRAPASGDHCGGVAESPTAMGSS